MISFITASLILFGIVLILRQAKLEHNRRLANLPIRIFVNGIRGKSTVTRLIAGVLRESGIVTLAKTTGSEAKVILSDGSEVPIIRNSATTIIELVETIDKYVRPETRAIVFDTMALKPANQMAAQEIMVKANITVITNIREDHQEVMGDTLEQIADTLSLTIPRNGILITCESRADLRERLIRNAAARGSRTIYADPAWVTDEEMKGFTYLSFRENVAVGLAVAQLLGIPRNTAMRGMLAAKPDIGVVNIQHVNWKGKNIVWAPLFAVNDRESVVIGLDKLAPYYSQEATRFCILNNREDKPRRSMEFADIAVRDLGSKIDYFITFGAYEKIITEHMIQMGLAPERIINLGFSVNPTLQQIIDKICSLVKGDQALLMGTINIHTPQAELLMEYFHSLPDAPDFVNDEYDRIHYRPRIERTKARMEARLENSIEEQI